MPSSENVGAFASAAKAPAHRPITALNQRSTPVLGARYWVLITLCSIAGCNLGDFISLYLNLGHWIGLAPLAVLFAILLIGERIGRPSEMWYWALLLVVRAAATNLADFFSHTLNIDYSWAIAGLEGLEVLLVLGVSPRQRDETSGIYGRPATDGWYWAALAIAGALGTAIGDCTAETFQLGTAAGTAVLGAIYAVLLVVGFRVRWSTQASYWLAVVAVRAAGTTAGDWLAFPDGGLGLGLIISTILTCSIFIAMPMVWRPRQCAGNTA
jgi:uncharacterized membrane-anchored protein